MKLFSRILVVVHLGILVFLAGTFLNTIISPEISPWFNLLSLSFPILMILNVILIVFWMILRKKRAIFFLLFSLIFFYPVKRWINFTTESSEKPNLKIVTLNAQSGILGEETIKNYLKTQKPDIVFFQESRFHKNERLKIEKLEHRAVCFIAEIQTNRTILREGTIFDKNFEGTSSFADIEVNGKVIRLINVYLSPFSLNKAKVKPAENLEVNQTKARYILKRLLPVFKIHQQEIADIRKAVDESPYPVIVAGDLNAVPNSYEYYTLGKGLTDAFEKVGNGSATSFHDYKFPLRIDYIFTSKSIKPISYHVDRSVKLSDHFPVIAEFKIE